MSSGLFLFSLLLGSALLLLGARVLAVPLVLSLVLVAASSWLFVAVGVVAVPPHPCLSVCLLHF